MRTVRRILLAVFTVACLITPNNSEAKKPDQTGGGGGGTTESPPRYQIIELGDYLATPAGISPASADDERVWVAGEGGELGYTAGMYSVISQSDGKVVNGYLPEPRTPLEGGPGSAFYGDTFNRASNAHAVNAAGDIVGGCDFYDPDAVYREFSEHRAVLWLNTENGFELIDLGLADPAHNFSAALDINDLGMIVGNSGYIDFGNEGFETYHRAIVWDPINGMTDLNDLLPEGSPWELQRAWAINNSGQICGAGLLNGVSRGFVFDLDSPSIEAVPLLPGAGTYNDARDINELGHVTGRAATGQTDDAGQPIYHAYLWTGTDPVDLGSLTGERSNGLALNLFDEVVGESAISSYIDRSKSFETLFFATYWNYGSGEMLALENEVPSKPKWDYFQLAGDINDQGWIVSHGRKTYRGTVSTHGVVLVPTN